MLWTVIIPTISRADLLSKTLVGLTEQSLTDFEAVVVCDGDDEETRHLSHTFRPSFPLRWIFLSENVGQAAARNVGAANAHGEYLLFLDDDTVPVPDCLIHHDRSHRVSGTTTTVVVGSIILQYERRAQSNAEQFLRRGRELSQRRVEASVSEADSSDTCFYFGVNCSLARHAFMRLGGFDPSLRQVDEDLEFGDRLHMSAVRFKHECHAAVVHNDIKDLVDYSVKCWGLTAEADIHRAFYKREPCKKTSRLLRIWNGGLCARVKERLSWHYPVVTRSLSELARDIGEITNSNVCFRWWCRLGNSVNYWEAVRLAGYGLEDLRALAVLSLGEGVGSTPPRIENIKCGS